MQCGGGEGKKRSESFRRTLVKNSEPQDTRVVSLPVNPYSLSRFFCLSGKTKWRGLAPQGLTVTQALTFRGGISTDKLLLLSTWNILPGRQIQAGVCELFPVVSELHTFLGTASFSSESLLLFLSRDLESGESLWNPILLAPQFASKVFFKDVE